MGPRSPFEDLAQEHMSLLTDVGDLQSSVRALVDPDSSALGGGDVVRDQLDMMQQRLRVHFRREEEAFFPEAQRMVSEGADGADVFGRFFAQEAEDDMSAHASLIGRANEMQEIMKQMGEAGGLDDASRRRLLALVNLTASLLQRHAAKEDTLILPMIKNSLTDEQIDAIGERLNKIASDRDLLSADEGGLSRMS